MTRQEPTAIALIPIKERSVRFPGKNFAKFRDTTLLAHAVEKLNTLPEIKQILISTDVGKKVATFLESTKTDVEKVTILERPPHLCDDIATTDAVINHVLSRQISMEDDEICVVTQVTSPLWPVSDLTAALGEFVDQKFETVVTVNPAYQPTGGFYIFRRWKFMKFRHLYAGRISLWKLPFEHSIDIDYPWQLSIADTLSYLDSGSDEVT